MDFFWIQIDSATENRPRKVLPSTIDIHDLDTMLAKLHSGAQGGSLLKVKEPASGIHSSGAMGGASSSSNGSNSSSNGAIIGSQPMELLDSSSVSSAMPLRDEAPETHLSSSLGGLAPLAPAGSIAATTATPAPPTDSGNFIIFIINDPNRSQLINNELNNYGWMDGSDLIEFFKNEYGWLD